MPSLLEEKPKEEMMKEERSGSTSSSGILSLGGSSSTDEETLNPQEAVEQLAIALSMTVLHEPNEPLFAPQDTNFACTELGRSFRPPYHTFDSDSGASSGEHSLEDGYLSNLPLDGSPTGWGTLDLNFPYPQTAAEWAIRRASNSLNVTDTVPVPSSEHVAEIVGRQGCKIKALRAKTNTYIKTPVRGEDAVFVVTGRREDVDEAKLEILNAAEHFTQIRASRRHSQGGAPAPGHVTAYVRVPYRVVGLVVGPKGGTIKRIQQDTHTYIITPSRDREPIFEVTGLPDNVECARREIEQHIFTRTGNLPISSGYDASYYAAALRTNHSPGSTPPNGLETSTAIPGMIDPNDFHLNGNESAFFGTQTCSANPVIAKPSLSKLEESTWGPSIFPPASSVAKSSLESPYPIWSNAAEAGTESAFGGVFSF